MGKFKILAMVRSKIAGGGQSKMAALKIQNVWLDNASCGKDGVETYLGVDLKNGHSATLSLSLTPKATDSLFAEIIAGKCNTEPKTDGDRVYWSNGASLTISEIMTMLRAENSGENMEGAKK